MELGKYGKLVLDCGGNTLPVTHGQYNFYSTDFEDDLWKYKS